MKDARQQRLDHPTGHVSTALPFWEELDDGDFEEFCTDWLNFHPTLLFQRDGRVQSLRVANACRLLAGTSQRGADIRAEMKNGEVWLLQCKRVKLFRASHIQKATKLAEKGNPDASQYVLITTCGLSEHAQQEKDRHAKWLWWDSSRLTTEVQKIDPVENGMKLVQRFFGQTWVERLFPWGANILLSWQEYFAQDLSSQRQLFHHRGEFLVWGDILARLQSFARDGVGRALVLSGGGGQGKSRLLLELARTLEAQLDAPRVRFLRIGGRSLDDKHLDLIGRQNNLLLIVEDAHRLDALVGQVAMAAARAETVRLLMATRPQAREAVMGELARYGNGERLELPLDLPRWRQCDVQALAEKVLEPSHQHQTPHLAAIADCCPLLVVLGGALINSGAIAESMTNERLFRERVFKGFVEEFLRHYEGPRSERLRRLIRLLAFTGPTAKDEPLFTLFSGILGCSALDVADDIDALQGAGLLAKNREGIRVYPDLFSDAVLLDACLDSSGHTSSLCRTVVKKLPATDFPALLRNLAQADWETRTKRGAEDSFFDPVWMEFAQRFEKAQWWDRDSMLRQWASFAPFQPERTLELARLAVKVSRLQPTRSDIGKGLGLDGPSMVFEALPAVLKPLVMWQPAHANQALDLLWSLGSEESLRDDRSDTSPIGTIANAAGFEVQPHHGPQSVLTWLENRLSEPAFCESIEERPWILHLVLTPFFGRVMEQSWQTGRSVTFRAAPLSVEVPRPFRNRALALAEKFANSDVPALARAGIQVLGEAIRGIESKFGYQPGAADYERWRPDRLEGVSAIGRAMTANANSHVNLLKIRKLLAGQAEYDQDQVVRSACVELMCRLPDTFELRLARALTSCSDDEFPIRSGAHFEADLREADRRWAQFCYDVALETARRFVTAERVCQFLKSEATELSSAGFELWPHDFAIAIAEISATWSASLLEESSMSRDPILDLFLSPFLKVALSIAPEAYYRAIDKLPRTGRPEQACSLINLLRWKHLQSGGLSPQERASIELCAQRTESQIIQRLASSLGDLSGEEKWTVELLSRLEARDDRDGEQILRALAEIIKETGELVEPSVVSHCLSNVQHHCISHGRDEGRSLRKIAERFPRPVYEHFRQLVDSAVDGESPSVRHIGLIGLPALGKLDDSEYVNAEIKVQWEKAKAESASRDARLALVRALIWSDSPTSETRLKQILVACENAEHLRLAAALGCIAITEGSRFVFRFPRLVRELMSRAITFGIKEQMAQLLKDSACGGGRAYSDNQLDPKYRYIREEAERLAAEHRKDPFLFPFYKMIVASENRDTEIHQAMFASDDDDCG